MITLTFMAVGYSIIWLIGMYVILHRLYVIRKRTEERMHEYDKSYILPTYRRPWVSAIIFGGIGYTLSIGVLIIFMKL